MIFSILNAGDKVLAGGGCRVNLCEKRLGLPHARYSQFQPASMAPPQGMAGSSSRSGGTSDIRKVKMLHNLAGGSVNPVNTDKRNGGGNLPGTGAGILLQPTENRVKV